MSSTKVLALTVVINRNNGSGGGGSSSLLLFFSFFLVDFFFWEVAVDYWQIVKVLFSAEVAEDAKWLRGE